MSEEDFSAELEEQQQDVLTTMTRLLECQSRMMQQQEEERKRIREESETERMRLQQEKEAEQKRLGQEWQLKLQHLQLQTEQLKKADVKEQEMRDFMIKQEQSRRQHEMELLEKQLEMEKMRTEQNRRNRRVEKMEPWRDADKPEAYLFKFERVMQEAAIPSEEWASRLIPLLTGKALTAYSNHVSVTATSDYETLKTALLDAMGLSLNHCRRLFWNYHRQPSDTPQEIAQHLESLLRRLLQQCKTPEDYLREFQLGRLLSLYPPEVAEFVQLRTPKTGVEAANLIHDHLENRQYWRDKRQQQWGSRTFDRGANGFRDERRGPEPANRESVPNGEYHKYGYGEKNVANNPPDNRPPDNRQNGFIPTCFACGQKGHKRPDCPNKIGRIGARSKHKPLTVDGRIGKHSCTMTIDTGAQLTVVKAGLVEEVEYTGETIRLLDFRGKASEVPLANVWVHTGEYSFKQEVAVCEDPIQDVLLGLDIGILDYLWELAKKQVQGGVEVNALTRAQAMTLAKQQQRDEQLSVQDQAMPVPIIAEHGENTQESDVEDDELVRGLEDEHEEESDVEDAERFEHEEESDDEVAKGFEDEHEDEHEAESESEDDVHIVGLEDEDPDVEKWPVPLLAEDDSEKQDLIRQQGADESLANIRTWAENGENGYAYQEGVLIHTVENEHGELWRRLVVPRERRNEIMRIAHSSLTGGHFSSRKTEGSLKRVFTWPGISRDAKNWCKTCPDCQKVARAVNVKAPLHPLPVISTPFSRLAFDLVGPLPRTKSGHRYLLTCICLGSKYPNAIPLRRVDAKTVAEGMCEIFSSTGIPQHILTDQGSVFTGKLTRELCELLGIKHLKTSPYHPQTDGCLERWHASLKSMLRKYPTRQSEWDRLLKYMLFAYRSAPHKNTGFSPFEMVYGRQLRGPLEVLKEGWVSGDLRQTNAVEWVNEVREKMSMMKELMDVKEAKAKQAMKKGYDKKATNRAFEEGSLVLVRTPDLEGKLADLWDGPFEVTRIISPVTYQLAVPHRRSKCMVAHINRLKEWHTPEASVMRVVVADEENESLDNSGRISLAEPQLTPEQSGQLKALLDQYQDVICPEVGGVNTVEHTIDTGTQTPIRSAPYRLAPAWREQLRKEISTLLESGIIKPSTSPWSSPMVPIRKPDGSVRLCIDFRKVNSATVPDPFAIPLIEDLLDQLGEARYLTKLDLNKGFYQIPVAEQDRSKTAFMSPWGKYEFIRMPFGLRNAPSTFQRCMNGVLQGLEDFSSAYIDDIVVFSRTWEEHLAHLKQVLDRLRKFHLTAKPSKCEWGAQSLLYLGHAVGLGKISVPEARVAALRNFRKPVTKADLRAFLGTIGYYRRFVPQFSQRAVPLTEATKKAAPNVLAWSDSMYDAFVYLCNVLSDVSVLFIPHMSDKFLLQTDASTKGIGAVFSVVRDGEEFPVGYYSKKLTKCEQNYAATELECLAVVRAIEHFAAHLVGRQFMVVTDHQALQYLQSSRHLNGRLTRWALQLQHHNFVIKHRPGKTHQNADGLSRQAWRVEEDQGPEPVLPTAEDGSLSEGGEVSGTSLDNKNTNPVVPFYGHICGPQ